MKVTQGKLVLLCDFYLAAPKRILLHCKLLLALQGETRREITVVVAVVDEYSALIHLATLALVKKHD
jgi:hypothetical protein